MGARQASRIGSALSSGVQPPIGPLVLMMCSGFGFV